MPDRAISALFQSFDASLVISFQALLIPIEAVAAVSITVQPGTGIRSYFKKVPEGDAGNPDTVLIAKHRIEIIDILVIYLNFILAFRDLKLTGQIVFIYYLPDRFLYAHPIRSQTIQFSFRD